MSRALVGLVLLLAAVCWPLLARPVHPSGLDWTVSPSLRSGTALSYAQWSERSRAESIGTSRSFDRLRPSQDDTSGGRTQQQPTPALPVPSQAPSATAAQLSALDAILARPEFQVAEGRSLLDRLFDPIRSWLRWLGWELLRLLDGIFGPATGVDGRAIRLVILAMALLLLLGVAVVARQLLRGTLAGDAAIADGRVAGPPRAADELARARDYAQAGDARRAVHHHYRAVLLRLDERDHLPFDGTLTNRELVPRLTAAPALAEPFAALIARFDRLWYGQTDCTAEEYAAFAALGDHVWRAAETVPPARANRGGTVSTHPASVAASGAR